jgi:hypothetical protein
VRKTREKKELNNSCLAMKWTFRGQAMKTKIES